MVFLVKIFKNHADSLNRLKSILGKYRGDFLLNVLGKKRVYSRIIRNIFQNNKRMNWGKNKGMYSRIIREWIGKKENVF